MIVKMMKVNVTYLLCRFHILNTIKAVATRIPQLEIVLIQMNNGNETVLSTRRTIVRSCGTCKKKKQRQSFAVEKKEVTQLSKTK